MMGKLCVYDIATAIQNVAADVEQEVSLDFSYRLEVNFDGQSDFLFTQSIGNWKFTCGLIIG